MKTAEEWTKELIGAKFIDDIEPSLLLISANTDTVNFIKQIQIDALKEGMRRAANIIRKEYVVTIGRNPAEQAILSAVEKLNENDL